MKITKEYLRKIIKESINDMEKDPVSLEQELLELNSSLEKLQPRVDAESKGGSEIYKNISVALADLKRAIKYAEDKHFDDYREPTPLF